MTTYLISYATPNFYLSQSRLSKSGEKFGINHCINFNSIWLSMFHQSFIKKNKKHFEDNIGAGYWVWKPYIILKTLEQIQENDVVIYLDSGIEIIKDITPLIDLVEKEDLLLFSTFARKNQYCTKPETFIGMDCKTDNYKECFQLEGGMLVIKNNKKNRVFIQQWLSYCENYSLVNGISDSLNASDGTIINHRHDQSILTNLSIKYKINPHRSVNQFANNLKSEKFRHKNEFLNHGTHLPIHLNNQYAPIQNIPKNSDYDTLCYLHRTSGFRFYQLPLIYWNMYRDAITTKLWLNT